MRRFRVLLLASLPAAALLAAPAADAQSGGWGRFSLLMQTARSKQDSGLVTDFSEIASTLTLRSPSGGEGGFEYAIDMRSATYPGTERDNILSVYDAYVGYQNVGGGLGLRVGQMWLNDLGGLGSLGGMQVEYRQQHPWAAGRFRFGLFAGMEPNYFKAGYVDGIKKGGAYVVFDGNRGWKNVLGLVTVRQQNLTERQVVTMLNFIPVGTKFFLYQSAEYDLQGPGGQGKGGLTYLFANVRYAPADVVEFQGTYHHGRSIDYRTITTDLITGRPVDPRLLDGLLLDSAGGRITVSISRWVRVWGGAYSDRTNLEDKPATRINAGFSTTNILGSGLDFTASDFRTDRVGNKYDSWYVSLGKSIGRSVYISADYTSSLSVVTLTDAGGVTVESRPSTKRYSLSSTINLSRVISVLITAERLAELTANQDRALLGLTFRF
jgi:hypothetical protein